MGPQIATPTSYVAGTITVPAGKPVGVLQLIRDQLNPNCPGTSVEFRIAADAANVAPVFIGQISGDNPISCSNNGGSLTPMGPARKYRASFPGSGTPQGEMQVFSEAPAKLHVEVNT